MGLFDIFLKNRPKVKQDKIQAFKMLNGYEPKFTTWGGEIYESELVRAAINARAIHVSKLRFDIKGSAKPALQNKLQKGPNQFQTWSQFLYRVSTILDVHNTAFLVPIFDQYGEVSGIFCPLPHKTEVVQYGFGDKVKPYLRYEFGWGEKASIELENCGILTKFQYKSDFFGETNHALYPTMDLIHIQNQGIEEGVKSAATYRFYAQVNNFSKTEDLAKERQRFSEENFSKDAQGGGLLLFPNTYSNINQVKSDPYVVKADEMKLINNNVYQYFMVNEDVLTNKAYGDAWLAFYEGAIEPFAIQFSEVMTKMLFTFREQGNGNAVQLTANRMMYLANRDKLSVSSDLLDRGVISLNDVREMWNLPPVEGGDVRIIRGEYYNADSKLSDTQEEDQSE
ncbi:MAG: phage portal protein [Lachnospiraceae bacterium]|nr:phage portal protein [Lachnospiraceae bacterium]